MTSRARPFLPFGPRQERWLTALAVLGLVAINGAFLYVAFFDRAALAATLADPVAWVLMAEALLLVALGAWLVHRSGLRAPGWEAFVVLSLLGSLAFSVPAFLLLASRRARAAAAGGS